MFRGKYFLLSWLLLTCIFLLGIQYLYTILLFPKNFRWRSWTQLQNVLQQSNNNLSYVVLGDSIAQNAIHPAYLSGHAFNYAFQGENILTTDLKLKSLYKQGVRIDYVIQEVGLGRFNSEWVDEKKHGENLFFLHYILNIPLYDITETYIKKIPITLQTLFPVLGSGRMRGYILKATTLDMDRGWIAHDGVWDSTSGAIIEETDRYFEITDLAATALLSLFSTIAEHDTQLILLIYPQGNKYILSSDSRKNEYIQEIRNLAEQYIDKDMYQVIDYYDLLDTCPTCFIDGGHANTSGAIIITKQLAEDIPLY